jgi:putrescine aminotransferase
MSTAKRTKKEWQKLDSAHYLHPFTDFKGLAKKGSRIIEKADGIYLWDVDGNKILDGMAGLWCVNMGYGRQDLVDAATKQLQQLPYYNSFFQTSHPPAIELSRLLTEVAPAHINHVFFAGSGSESNDTVIRLVRRYWQLKGQPDRQTIISRVNAYHGSTIGGATLGGMKGMHDQLGLTIPGVVHIDQPYWFGYDGDLDRDAFGLEMARRLEKKILELGVDNVAAFIGEPIQGAGGVIIPPATYWPEIQRICDKYGILLVADEVITGFGRLGEWFGSQYFGIKPDLITFAKGVTSGYLPLGGVLVGDRIGEVLTSDGGEFTHGYTYSGHPACCAVAIKNIELLRDEKVVEQVKNVTGPHYAKRWAELADHPLVGEVRTTGLMGAIELVKNKKTRELFTPRGEVGFTCRDACFANGLVMRSVGDTMISAPPLVITVEQIDEMARLARKCLDDTAAKVL